MIKQTMTYDLMSPESIEHGDAEERGYVTPDRRRFGTEFGFDPEYIWKIDAEQLADLLDEHYHTSEHPVSPGRETAIWLSSDPSEVSIEFGTTLITSIHLHRSTGQAGRDVWCDLIRERHVAAA